MSSPYEVKNIDLRSDVVWHKSTITSAMRAELRCRKSRCIWLTGLSGSGKSTVANELDAVLHANKVATFLLDGDNVRHVLNKDLGMSEKDRIESIWRVGEVSKLMVLSASNYRPADYIRFGLPLALLVMIIALFMISQFGNAHA